MWLQRWGTLVVASLPQSIVLSYPEAEASGLPRNWHWPVGRINNFKGQIPHLKLMTQMDLRHGFIAHELEASKLHDLKTR